MGEVLRLAFHRQRTTFRRRRGAYLSLVLLLGSVGGLSLGALSAARRTQSSFSTYLASTNPSNLTATVFGGQSSGGGSPPVYSAAATRALGRLPGVAHVEVAVPVAAAPLLPSGAPRVDTASDIQPIASVDGLFFDQDRLAVTAGRMAKADRPDEIIMTPLAAHLYGFHIGEVIPYGVYNQSQQALPGFGTASVPPYRRLNTTLVGLVQPSTAIVQDDIDEYPTFVFFTPAFGQVVAADANQGAITYGFRLDHGNKGVTAVEQEFARVAPSGNSYGLHAMAPVEAKVDRTVRPLAIALGVFGGVTALAALLIAIQLIARQLRDADQELSVLRAIGAGPSLVIADGVVGVLVSILFGCLAAAALAALSPVPLLGPVRPVYPARGIAADWVVLGIGVPVLAGGLGIATLALAFRGAPHRAAGRSRRARPKRSTLVEVVAATGLPAPAVVGVRFSLEPGSGATAVPVRSALLGATLAVALVVATLTFGSGLRTLVGRPPLYGWDFSYMLNASNTTPRQTLSLLDQDPDVVAWQGYDYTVAELDGEGVPFLVQDGESAIKAPISPPLLAGHAVAGKDQIVLGAATLAQLHKRVGDTVIATYGSANNPVHLAPTRLVIVGTATMPAVGFSSVISDHTSMGTGALISFAAFPDALQQALSSSNPLVDGPNLVFVRLRPGVRTAAGVAGLQRIADAADKVLAAAPNGGGGGDVSVVGVQRPAEIVNYRSMGATPAVLASGLAAGAIIALALTLAASVRRRRRDLALLKTLGFTHRQLAAAVAWQASVAAIVGIVIGLPVGIAAGRWLWTLFARQIYAVPQPSVPTLSLFLVAVGGLLLANLVAALPGRSAARTPTAVLLRVE